MEINSIELFCLTVETGSFTAAAKLAGVTPAAVSRSVGRLEQRLKTRLFVRTTRQMRTTDKGEDYYRDCRKALNLLVDAETHIISDRTCPIGILKISVPTVYAHYRLLPRLKDFCAQYPDLKIDLEISNHNINFSENNFDVAIRGNYLKDSSLIVRHLEDAELIIVASPSYLQGRATPQSIADLKSHNCLQYSLPSTGRPIPWSVRDNNQQFEIKTDGNITCRDDFLATLTLAKNGAGLMQVYAFTVEDSLKNGELIEVLQQNKGATRPFNLIYPSATHLPLKVRKFIDFLNR